MSNCTQEVLDLRGENIPVILNSTDTFSLLLRFKESDGVTPRDMSTADVRLHIDGVEVLPPFSIIAVGGDNNEEISIIYTPLLEVGSHTYAIIITQGLAQRGEIYGKITVK